MRSKLKYFLVLPVIFGIAGGWLLWTNSPVTAPTERVAALTDLTSYTAEYGQQELAGLRLAVEDLSAADPPRPFVLDVQDTKGSPRDALNGLAQILSARGQIALLFTALSSVSTAVLPEADRGRLLTLCNATTNVVLKVSPYSIRNFPSPEVEFASLYDGAVEPLKLVRLGMLFINDEYGQSMSALFRKRAGKAGILNEAYGFDVNDFRPLVTRIRATGLDGVIVVGYGSQAGSFVRQLREGGFQGRILVPSLIVNTDSVAKAAGKSLSGVIFNGYTYDTANPATQSLLTRFRTLYSGRQSDIGVLAYVGAKTILQYQKPGASPADTIAALEAAQPFETVVGKVGFSNRSFLYPLKLYEVTADDVVPFSASR